MTDPQIGVAIRFIQQYDIAKDQVVVREDTFASMADVALWLAMCDMRDLPTAIKVADAWNYVHSQLM